MQGLNVALESLLGYIKPTASEPYYMMQVSHGTTAVVNQVNNPFEVEMPIIHLPLNMCLPLLHILQSVAQVLDRCPKQCFHLVHLVARHILFGQHGFLLNCLIPEHPDLDGKTTAFQSLRLQNCG